MCRLVGRNRKRVASLVLGLHAILQLASRARGDVYIMTTGYVLDPLPDIPADFGPEIPDEGIEGLLRIADPEDACSPFTFSDFQTPWVALIARQQQLHANNCTFDVKVQNAQAAGALAAIVYDDVYESLIIMSKPKGHPDPLIPSVFVSQKAGIIMHKLMTLDTIRVRITPLSNVAWLSMLMSAFLGVLALGVVLATFYVMRSWSMWITGMNVRGPGNAPAGHAGQGQAGHGGRPAAGPLQEPGLPADALRSLPVLVFEPSASTRPSLAPSAAPSGAASLGSLPGSMSQAHARMAAVVGASVWAAEDGDEEEAEADEMRPLLDLPPGDVEEGRGGCLEDADEAEELASRSSSEGGAGALPISGRPVPRPPGAHAGETKRVCTICLESYQEGDKIRVLPCAHRFHMGCVDQWLGGRRFCPVCKHDASKPLPAPAASPREGSASTRAGGAGGGGGLSLLWRGFMSIMRRPGVVVAVPAQGAAAVRPAGVAYSPARPRALRSRTRRQQHRQQHLQQLRQASGRAAAAPELQEPFLNTGGAQPVPTQPQQQPPRPAARVAEAAPAGDIEAPEPSTSPLPAAPAAPGPAAPQTPAASRAVVSAGSTAAASGGAAGAPSVTTEAGSSLADAGPAASAASASGREQQPALTTLAVAEAQAGAAAGAMGSGTAASALTTRVRSALAGLLRPRSGSGLSAEQQGARETSPGLG